MRIINVLNQSGPRFMMMASGAVDQQGVNANKGRDKESCSEAARQKESRDCGGESRDFKHKD